MSIPQRVARVILWSIRRCCGFSCTRVSNRGAGEGGQGFDDDDLLPALRLTLQCTISTTKLLAITSVWPSSFAIKENWIPSAQSNPKTSHGLNERVATVPLAFAGRSLQSRSSMKPERALHETRDSMKPGSRNSNTIPSATIARSRDGPTEFAHDSAESLRSRRWVSEFEHDSVESIE